MVNTVLRVSVRSFALISSDVLLSSLLTGG